MKTLEQEFATKIYKQVSSYINKENKGQYGSMAFTLPVLVRSAGLAQALAFVESRNKETYNQLLNHIAEVVMVDKQDQTKDKYVERSRSADLEEYMYLTKRTLLALKWYKRFAQSVLGVTATETNVEGGV